MKKNNLLCILRTQNERTENLSRLLLENEVGKENVIVIHEAPFAQAVIRSFELGIDSGSEWTFCFDGDVLVVPEAINKCIEDLDQVLPKVFKIQPRLISKIHGAKIAAGFHIYRTSLLNEALKYIKPDINSLRPETFVLREMIKNGYSISHLDKIVGIHEYELYYSDIYRRMRLRGTKGGKEELEYLRKRLIKMQDIDPDFRVALKGIDDSLLKPIHQHSINSIDSIEIQSVLNDLGLKEKSRISDSINGDFVIDIVKSFSPDSDALAFTQKFESLNFPKKGIKILLISSASVGPLYISTLLKNNNHEVKRLYQGYEDYLGEPSAPFNPPYREEELLEYSPDVIGFSVESSTFKKAELMASKIKRILPNCFIIFGGAHATDCPEEIIKYESIDAICIGEGEYPMLEVCNELNIGRFPLKVKNIWIKHNGEIIRNDLRPYIQDLDTIPMDRDNIWYGGLFTGRGCVGRCSFCNIPAFRKHGPKGKFFRKLTIESAMKEVEIVYRGTIEKVLSVKQTPLLYKVLSKIFSSSILSKFYNTSIWVLPQGTYRREKEYESVIDKIKGRTKWIDPVRFKDDTFLADKKWFLEFAKRLNDKFPNMKYICQARANEIDEEVALWLSRSGCVRVSLGFETGNEKLRNEVIKKNIKDSQIYFACELLRKNNIEIMGQWMYGLPDERLEDTIKTLIMSTEIGDISQLHFTSPLPNTELYNLAAQKGLIDYKHENKGLYSYDLIFHNEIERLHILLISLLHVLKDVRIPVDYKYIRYLGSDNNWRGKTIGEVFSIELKSKIKY
ncbi:MAG: radical SAM protein [Spirochaetota bacterium]